MNCFCTRTFCEICEFCGRIEITKEVGCTFHGGDVSKTSRSTWPFKAKRVGRQRMEVKTPVLTDEGGFMEVIRGT